MTAREQILGSLNRVTEIPATKKAGRVGSSVPTKTIPALGTVSAKELLDYFLEQCTRARATSSILDSRAAIPNAVRAFLSERDLAEEVVVGEALRDLDWSGLTCLDDTADRLMGDGLSIVTEAQYAVAETGSIVALSGSNCDPRLNFLAETHIAVLSKSAVVATAEDVWISLRRVRGERDMPRAVNFVTGPSRTADIEQTIELGAHGPRRLHVILVGD